MENCVLCNLKYYINLKLFSFNSKKMNYILATPNGSLTMNYSAKDAFFSRWEYDIWRSLHDRK